MLFAAWLYRDTLSVGFLLDDFFHLDYLMRAFGGEPNALLKLLWSNWSSDTTMISYRPLVSFSLAADYALWHINATGYHATNLVMFGGCIAFVALIAKELCAAFELSNGTLVAIGAAFLFAAYPLHPEAVTWIIGRVDVLCGLFLFASTYFYLLNRKSGKAAPLVASVTLFILALMSKEMAVTLPIILTGLELLAPVPSQSKLTKFKMTQALLIIWAALAVFAVWRTMILGTLVGGYGGSGWRTIRHGWKNFRDPSTLTKLFYGVNEEFPANEWLKMCTLGALGVATVGGIFSVIAQRNLWRFYLFLFGWAFCTILPTFQIWHIYPNLVGSRLFFIGSAPLCMLIAAAALGMASRYKTIVGGIAIGVITFGWSSILETNLSAWIEASHKFKELQHEISTNFRELSPSFKIFIPILPQDYKGAPIIGRPEYLDTLLKPPFADKDYTEFVLTAEPYIAGGMEYVGPNAFAAGSHEAKKTLIFDKKDILLTRISDATIQAPRISLSPQPPLSLADRNRWLHHNRKVRPILDYDATAVPRADHVSIYIGKPWQPFSNAPRAVPPEPQWIEREVSGLPLKSSTLLPQVTDGVHDITVLAFDKENKPVGVMSETVSINSHSD